jgi:hypothetical protein
MSSDESMKRGVKRGRQEAGSSVASVGGPADKRQAAEDLVLAGGLSMHCGGRDTHERELLQGLGMHKLDT